MNEHHRTPRSHGGGRAQADLNIAKVGIRLHQTYHALFGTKKPEAVCEQINRRFLYDAYMLVVVPTRDFATFHRYFTGRKILSGNGMASYGVTWGHLFLYGSHDDLHGTFRHGRHYFAKPDPEPISTCRWQYLFGDGGLAKIAFELTKHWLPLSVVVVSIPRIHSDEVLAFIAAVVSGSTVSKRTRHKPPN